MLKPLLALLVSAAPAAAAFAQAEPVARQRWTLADSAQACMVHASSDGGTVLSISAMPGEESLLFIVQNPALANLGDGEQVPIMIEFDDQGEWRIGALAQAHLDSDGPGVIFAVRPGRADGANFIKEFSTASGMSFGREDGTIDNVPLAGGNDAMANLGACLSEKWAGIAGAVHEGQGGPIEEEPLEGTKPGEEAVPL